MDGIFSIFMHLANWLTYGVLGLEKGESLAESVHFFFYDVSKILVLIVLIIYIISLLRASFDMEKIRHYLEGKNRFTGYLMAAFFGSVTPFCSCSSIPIFLGFTKAKIPIGITMSFLITSPIINEVALVLLGSVLGWKFMVSYLIIGVLAGVVGGLFFDKIKAERFLKNVNEADVSCCGTPKADKDNLVTSEESCCTPGVEASCCAPKVEESCCTPAVETSCCAPKVEEKVAVETSCCAPKVEESCCTPVADKASCCAPKVEESCCTPVAIEASCCAPKVEEPTTEVVMSWKARHEFAKDETKKVFEQIWKWVIIGIAAGAVFHGYVPAEWIESNLGDGAWWTVPLATVLGIPLYADATSIVPIAESMLAKGVPVGTMLALMMSVVGASFPEFLMLKQVMKTKMLVMFFVLLLVLFTINGWIFNLIAPWIGV